MIPDLDNVRRALESLGETSFDVADALLERGCLGAPREDSGCPVHRYLVGLWPGLGVSVGRDAVMVYKAGNAADHERVPLPAPVASFVLGFDGGFFPSLDRRHTPTPPKAVTKSPPRPSRWLPVRDVARDAGRVAGRLGRNSLSIVRKVSSMKRIALVLLLLLAAAGFSFGACRVVARQVVVQKAVAVQAVAVAPVAVATFVPIVNAAVPTYSIGYSQAEEVERLRQELDAIKSGIVSAPQGKSAAEALPVAPRAVDAPAYLKVLESKCAACHEQAVSKAKGGGFSLLEGRKLRDLKPEQIVALLSKTKLGIMPKDSAPLSDEEFSSLLELLEHKPAK